MLESWEKRKRFLPQSLMGKAISYAFEEWHSLLLYLEYGQVEIDNNLVKPKRSGDRLPRGARRVSEANQNAIRPTAIGKKNWMFIGEVNAGDRSAIIYSIIESCRRRRIDPYSYLREVSTRLPSTTNQQIKELTPEA